VCSFASLACCHPLDDLSMKVSLFSLSCRSRVLHDALLSIYIFN